MMTKQLGDHKGTPLRIPNTMMGNKKIKTIGDMMDVFKSIVRAEYIHGVKNLGWDRFDGKLLQRDYYEHIIRDEE